MDVNTVKKPREKFRGDIGLLFLTLSSQFLLVVVMPFSLIGQTPYSVKFISLSAY